MDIQITVRGNLGSDPELRFTPAGKAVADFRIASTPRLKQGTEWVDGETIWFKVTAWGALAEGVAECFTKGSAVLVTGSLKQTTFKGKDGQDIRGLEINAETVGLIPKAITSHVAQTQQADTPPW